MADALHDAGDGPLPKGLLLGHFASRTYLFTEDGFATARGIGYAYVVVRREGDHVTLSDHFCSIDGAWALFVQATSSFVYPPDLAPHTVTVKDGSDGWHTDDNPYALGYDFQPPSTCTPGQTISDPLQRSWNGGTCTCPAPATLPSDPNDCRVTDPDHDGQPGLSLSLSVNGSSSAPMDVVQENHDTYAQGRTSLDNRGMLAQFISNAKASVVKCSGGPCTLGNPKPCTPINNATEFVPISEKWTCADVLAHIAELFPTPPPDKPTNCSGN